MHIFIPNNVYSIFYASSLTFRSMVHFVSIFLCDVRKGTKFSFLHKVMQ